MDYLAYHQRLQYIIELLEKDQIRSPHDLATRFECTEKTIRNMINRLREQGNQIMYCKKSGKYVLEKK